MRDAIPPVPTPVALLTLLSWLLLAASGCNPGAFDDLVGDERPADGGGGGGSKDGGGRTPRDSGEPGARPMDAAVDGASAVDGAMQLDGSSYDGGPDDAGFDGGDGSSDAGPQPCSTVLDPDHVSLRTMDLGAMPIPIWVSTRALLASAAVGERVVFTFSVPPARQMVAWGDRKQPMGSLPQLNEKAPFVQLLPPAADPEANPNLPIGLSSIIGVNGDEALIFYSRLYYLLPIAVGIAKLGRDQTEAEVVRPLDLFPPAEPPAPGAKPWRPMYASGPVIEESNAGPLLYLYACHPNPNHPEEMGGLSPGPCRVARVALADVGQHAAYKHWNGSDWVDDALQAVPVLTGVPGGLTVSFNRYLKKFLAVHSGLSDNVMLRSADRPEGPWRTLGSFGTLPSDGFLGVSFGATEHVALRDACHDVIYITYGRLIETTNENGAPVSLDESHMVRVEFQ